MIDHLQATFENQTTRVLDAFLLIGTQVAMTTAPNGQSTCAKMPRSKLVEKPILKVWAFVRSGKRPIDREFTNML